MSKVVYLLYWISHLLYLIKIPLLPKMITYTLRLVFNCWIPYQAKIGKGVVFGKGGLGIVIHEKSKIGDCCIISHNVTIGGGSKKTKGKLPVIGKKCRIGANSVIIGNVKIGNNVIIAAGSIVTKDVPDNVIVAGNPVKIIKENINIDDYVDFKC